MGKGKKGGVIGGGGKEVLRVVPKEGAGLFHWHGDKCLLHEGAPVFGGVKYLLRTDVLYR